MLASNCPAQSEPIVRHFARHTSYNSLIILSVSQIPNLKGQRFESARGRHNSQRFAGADGSGSFAKQLQKRLQTTE